MVLRQEANVLDAYVVNLQKECQRWAFKAIDGDIKKSIYDNSKKNGLGCFLNTPQKVGK